MTEHHDPLRSLFQQTADYGRARADAAPAAHITERGKRSHRRRVAVAAVGTCLVLAGGSAAAAVLLPQRPAPVAPATSPSPSAPAPPVPSPPTSGTPTTSGRTATSPPTGAISTRPPVTPTQPPAGEPPPRRPDLDPARPVTRRAATERSRTPQYTRKIPVCPSCRPSCASILPYPDNAPHGPDRPRNTPAHQPNPSRVLCPVGAPAAA